MKTLVIFVGIVMAAGPVFGACGADHLPLIDWGLHRQYWIERDCAHPERPARLVEVPWSDADAGRARDGVRAKASSAVNLVRPPLLVHAGARVTVVEHTATAGVDLVGTALEPGHVGDSIRVRAGFRNAILRGIVRGPGLVELEPTRGRK